jgi:hypothetical protein
LPLFHSDETDDDEAALARRFGTDPLAASMLLEDPRGRPVLHIAAHAGHAAAVRTILGIFARAAGLSDGGEEAWETKCGNGGGDAACSAFTLYLDARDRQGDTALYTALRGWNKAQHQRHGVAAASGHPQVLAALLDAGADWRTAHPHGEPPMFTAAVRFRNLALVQRLRRIADNAGCTVGTACDPARVVETRGEWAPLHVLYDLGEWQVLISKFVLTRGPSDDDESESGDKSDDNDMESVGADGASRPLHNSLKRWGLHLDAAMLEGLEQTYDRALLDASLAKWTAQFEHAILRDDGAAAAAAEGASSKNPGIRKIVNAADTYGGTPLMFAAYHGDDTAVARLLARGADPAARDTHGRSALYLALTRNQRRAVAVLAAAAATEPLETKGTAALDTPFHPATASLYGWPAADPAAGVIVGADGETRPAGRDIGSGPGQQADPDVLRQRYHRVHSDFPPIDETEASGYQVPSGPGGWNDARAAPVDISRCDIDRRVNLSAEAFVREYLLPGKPVVLRGAAEHWPAMKRWTRRYMAEQLATAQSSPYGSP